jgi:type 1 fimbriae regulatory protein FimB/type 1 fimbriae regulatory protein FimE
MVAAKVIPMALPASTRNVDRAKGRRSNKHYRTREYLSEAEIMRLVEVAKSNRNGLRDSIMVLVAYRHALRAAELVGLRWDQVDFTNGTLHVSRVKNGTPSVHPLTGKEMRLLRSLHRQSSSPFVFVSERGSPFTTHGFYRLFTRLGVTAGIGLKIHPHMARHSAGYALINRGVDIRTLQAFMGHSNITSTTVYSHLASGRFKNLWRD